MLSLWETCLGDIPLTIVRGCCILLTLRARASLAFNYQLPTTSILAVSPSPQLRQHNATTSLPSPHYYNDPPYGLDE